MASSEPHFESLKAKAIFRRFRDELLATIMSSDKPDEVDFEPHLERYRGWCKDLEEEEDAIREDKTICIKRTRSPSPHGERKRHCERIETSDPSDTVACSTTPETCCSTNTTGSIEALRPKPGEVYYAYHEQSQRRLAAVVLPLTDPGSIGILGTMETLGFSKNVPNCVVYNVNSGRLEWRDGYGDGEPSSHARKYPVIYFTGRKFPENEAAGWVLAEELRVLDEENLRASDIPFYRAVRAYQERRTLCQTFREREIDPVTPLVENNQVLGPYESSRSCPIAPLPAPNVNLMGPDKSRYSIAQSSWSAHSYGRSLMQGYSEKLPVKLPWPRPTNPSRSCHWKMPSTLNFSDSCRLTGYVVVGALCMAGGALAAPSRQTAQKAQYQDSPVDEKRNTKTARVQKEAQVMPQLATPDPESELQSSMVSPSKMDLSSDQRDQEGDHTAESDPSSRDPDIIAQSIEDFIQASQDEISYFSSAENSERTYQLLLALIEEPQEEARWTDGAEWLSLLESGRRDRKKGTIHYAITAIAFTRWYATQVRLCGDEIPSQQASQQVSARILSSHADNDKMRRKKQKKLHTHLARGRKWLRLVEALGMGILFKNTWKLAKAPELVINVIVEKMPNDEKKMVVLRLLEDQMRLLLQTGRTNTDTFCNGLKMQELASSQATFTTSFTQLQEIQTSVTGGELVVKRCM
ncbi:hypothetical protein FCOIX_12690 [Fusarium coicis]|nr:hypothetical protein FCOIX_12690 [Fusarium coicis]